MPPMPPSLTMLPPGVVDTDTPFAPPAYQRATADMAHELTPSAEAAAPGAGAEPPPGAGVTPQLQTNPQPILTQQQFVDKYLPKVSASQWLHPIAQQHVRRMYEDYQQNQMAMSAQTGQADRLMLGRENTELRRAEGGGRRGRSGRQPTPEEMVKARMMLEILQGDKGGTEARDAWGEYQTALKPKGPETIDPYKELEKAAMGQLAEKFPNDPFRQIQEFKEGQKGRGSAGGGGDSGLLTKGTMSELLVGKHEAMPQLGKGGREGGLVSVFREHGPIVAYLAGRQRVDGFKGMMDEGRANQVEQYVESRRPSIDQLTEAWKSGKFQDPEFLKKLVQLGILTEEELAGGTDDPWYAGANYDKAARVAFRKVIEKILPAEQLTRFNAKIKGKG